MVNDLYKSYYYIHQWIRRHKKKPILCDECKKKKPLQLANISGYYKKDINDWLYCCEDCHRDKHKEGKHTNIKFKGFKKEHLKNIKKKNPKQYLKELTSQRTRRKRWEKNNPEKVKVIRKNQKKDYWKRLKENNPKQYKKELEARKIYGKKWRKENSSHTKKYDKNYRAKHKEEKKQYDKQNEKEIKEYKHNWYLKIKWKTKKKQ